MLTNMGRINSKSRKILINAPKYLAYQQGLIRRSLKINGEGAMKVQESMRGMKSGHIVKVDCQGKIHHYTREGVETVKLKVFEYRGWANKVRGLEKLNGLVVPKGE